MLGLRPLQLRDAGGIRPGLAGLDRAAPAGADSGIGGGSAAEAVLFQREQN